MAGNSRDTPQHGGIRGHISHTRVVTWWHQAAVSARSRHFREHPRAKSPLRMVIDSPTLGKR